MGAAAAVTASRPSRTDRASRRLRAQYLGRVCYAQALALQESTHHAKRGGEETDHLLLLEHDPVYTLGRGADAADLRAAPQDLGVPVFRVRRGGGATFHGPGQLVGYPIVHLGPNGRGVRRYVQTLEESMIATCAAFGVNALTHPGHTGVWVGDEKIAAIGIGVRRGISDHGVALNVMTDVSYFRHIVPCRTSDLHVTTLERVLGWAPPIELVAATFARCFARRMGMLTLEFEVVR